jgi:hypothetical protein
MRYSKQIQWVTASAAIATLGLWLGTDQDRGSQADVPAAVIARATAPAGTAAVRPATSIAGTAMGAARPSPAAYSAYFDTDGYDTAIATPPAANGRDAPLQIQQQQDAGPQPKDERLSTRVAALARSASPRPMEVVVRFDATPTEATHSAIRAAGGQIVRSYEKLPLRAVRISRAEDRGAGRRAGRQVHRGQRAGREREHGGDRRRARAACRAMTDYVAPSSSHRRRHRRLGHRGARRPERRVAGRARRRALDDVEFLQSTISGTRRAGAAATVPIRGRRRPGPNSATTAIRRRVA